MQKGFTLIEAVIVVAIFAFLSGVAIPRLSAFNQAQQLEQTALDFKDVLEEARSRALSSQAEGGDLVHWAVRVEAGGGQYYIGPTNGMLAPTVDRRYYLPAGITLSPEASVVFTRLSGEVMAGSSITYTLTKGTESVSVTVYGNGTIE